MKWKRREGTYFQKDILEGEEGLDCKMDGWMEVGISQ